eukprot:CAMPEP_0206605720 /NCGR_PEP_ID=MMETSP0325_2-20121206/50645_1 /ASSEMBLY_ACC=CAM_ASM_000347 /TAXON_ID=2866 /ORGANISM="Crypthecodinium cohnii, Strain Seligo" /LENGTH=308 /DNA_ID=CAMNT_0054121441 /DNA_START=181 /DNA_END=1107 /DNA_ORIENTATION=-
MTTFEPEPRPKTITMRLVLERSLSKAELAEYDALDEGDAFDKVRSLKTIRCDWSNIGEISSLEPFEAAEVLYLQYNRIPRIENLDCLPRLQFLALQGNQITAIENLDRLTELEVLDLSKNYIGDLDEEELPTSINILNLKENPCTEVDNYKARLLKRLPDLLRLDGEDIGDRMEEALKESVAPTLGSLTGSNEVLTSTEKGLGAYWKKGQMQSSMQADMKERIEAFSMESLADVQGFDRRLAEATARSVARRKSLEEAAQRPGSSSSLLGSSGVLGGSNSLPRPGTAARLLEAAFSGKSEKGDDNFID